MLGLLRLPDVYTRLHATGKVSALGASFLVFAAIAATDLTIWKGFILIFLLLLGSPVVSHVIASAAYKAGVPMAKAQRDDLAKVLPRNSGKDI
jgi:multicomponent Na+:H+ antiporter subunit G